MRPSLATHRWVGVSLLSLLQWADISTAWVNSSTEINLSWPPVSVWRDININGNSSVANWDNLTSTPFNVGYDCHFFAVGPDVARTDFPITGGMIQLDFDALFPESSETSRNPWTVHLEIGQFAGLSNDYWIGTPYFRPISQIDNMTFSGAQFVSLLGSSTIGSYCSSGLDIPATITYAQETWPWWGALPSPEELIGMNATLGISTVKWNGSLLEGNLDQMTQCSYIRFVEGTEPLGPCRSPTVLEPVPNPLPSSSVSSTPGGSSISPSSTTGVSSARTPTSSMHGPSQTSYTTASTHGLDPKLVPVIVVPVVVFVALIVGVWCCFAACRRARRQRGAEEAVETGVKSKGDGQIEDKKAGSKAAEKTGKKSEEGEDDDSIRKAPPPNYTDALGDYIVQAAREKPSTDK